jgi:DNA-binding transcriptional LysR family regulator
MERRKRRRICANIAVSALAKRPPIRAGSSAAGKTETIQTHGRYAANHTAVRLDAVKQNLGIGSLPLFTAREALARGEIVQVLPEWEFISRYSGQLWLLWSGNKHMPARMRAMIDYLSEKMKPASGSP